MKLEVSFRGVMARKRDAPEYVHRMQKELFEALAWAGEGAGRSCRMIEPRLDELPGGTWMS